MTKNNKRLLFLMIMILSTMPLIISYAVVFCGVMLMYGIDTAAYMMLHPMILGGIGVYLAWRFHLNYNRLKRIIIEEGDSVKDLLTKLKEQQFNDKFGR